MADKKLQSITFPQLGNRYLVTGNIEENGTYPEMSVGSAENLIGTQLIEEKMPYLYRQSGGGANIGNREYDEIVGGSVVWNQLFRYVNETYQHNGITFAMSDSGKITVSGTASADAIRNYQSQSFTAGHKILLKGCPNGGSQSSYYMRNGYMGQTESYDTGNGTIMNVGANFILQVGVKSGITISNLVFKPQIIDLTAMFGTAIADYIYNLEQSSAGAGVAFFRKLFPNDYYPYDTGTLKHVGGVSSHEMVGFNQWDEEWEFGNIDSSGQNAGSSKNYIRSKNYIPVISSARYCLTCSSSEGYLQIYLLQYDENKNLLSRTAFRASSYIEYEHSNTFVLASNAKYVRFFLYKTPVYTDGVSVSICINISSDRNGEYEPYKSWSYPLDDSLTLRGVPKLDASNNLYWDGDTYEADGTVTRRYGIVDLGTLNWLLNATNEFTASLSGAKGAVYANIASAMCAKYLIDTYNHVHGHSTDKTIAILSTNSYVYVYDTAYTDAAAFKTAMSGVYLVYELATPTTETAEPFHNPQTVDPYGTEEYATTSIVPVGHYTKYSQNLTAKLEGLPWNFATLIAPTETAYKATRNYTTGSLFIVNNILYKATANIANGGTITPNTNCTATTLAEVISALS